VPPFSATGFRAAVLVVFFYDISRLAFAACCFKLADGPLARGFLHGKPRANAPRLILWRGK